MSITPATALAALPEGLRDDVVESFNHIVRNYREHRWEPAELNGGKLCEAVFTAITGHIDGQYAERSTKPRNMLSACQALEHKTGASRAVRIQIPRMLIALYEIRNNRGVGHAGGDVNPNLMDATAVLYMSKWLLAELIRVLHDLTTEQASRLVEGLIEREVPHIWTDGSKKRVLKSKITWKQKALLLLLSESEAISEQELFRWSEHSNASRFRREVLRPAHKEKLIEFDEIESTVQLLPPGIAQAEDLVNSI